MIRLEWGSSDADVDVGVDVVAIERNWRRSEVVNTSQVAKHWTGRWSDRVVFRQELLRAGNGDGNSSQEVVRLLPAKNTPYSVSNV